MENSGLWALQFQEMSVACRFTESESFVSSWNKGRSISATFEESRFSISAGMLSEPAAFSFFTDFIA
jgi:hypothetical protein